MFFVSGFCRAVVLLDGSPAVTRPRHLVRTDINPWVIRPWRRSSAFFHLALNGCADEVVDAPEVFLDFFS
jgi:hypothetical protein